MSSQRLSIFVCGVKNVSNATAEQTQKALGAVQADVKRLTEEGFDPQMHLVDPEADVQTEVANFTKALQGRPKWDGVSIGFGVRGVASLTPLFEGLVNAVLAQQQQPPPKMVFTEMYDKLYVSFRRAFPL